MLAIVLALIAASGAWAQTPPAPPPPAPPKAVDPFESGQVKPLPLSPELLKRWGFDVDKVLALPPAKRLELQKDVTLLELGRLRRLELLRKIRPDDWQGFVDADQKLTPEGMRLVDEYLAKLGKKPMLVPAQVSDLARKDGKPLSPEDRARLASVLDRMFDGVSDRADGSMLGQEVVVDAKVRNETVYSMTITNPKTGLVVEVGQLYVDGRNPNAINSPYANLMWSADSKPDSWVDYRFKAQLGYVDLRARYFADAGGSAQVNQLLNLGQSLGVPQSALGDASRYLTYDDPYKAHGLIVTSLLSEIGRAYNLYGPLDLVWTAGNLTKIAWIAPNTAFDETLGLRVRLNKDLSLGFFGGAAENVSPVGNDLLGELLRAQTIKPGLYMETAPHASVALWGKVPGVSDLSFSASATERRNETTDAHSGEISLMTTFQQHPLALRGILSDERGRGIEYDRQQARAQLDYQLTDRLQAYLAYERDHIKYGNAKVDSDAFLIGLEASFGGGDSKAAGSVSVDHLFGGQYQGRTDPMTPYLKETLAKINSNLVAGLDVADRASALYQKIGPDLGYNQLEGDLNKLSLALQHLDPNAAGQLIDQLDKARLSEAQRQFLGDVWLKTVSKDAPYYNDIRSRLVQGLGGGNLQSDLFWAQSQGAAKIQQALGVTLSPAQQQSLSDFFGRAAQTVQSGSQLTPAQMAAIDREGLALIDKLQPALNQAERQQMINLVTQQARGLGQLIQDHRAQLAAGAERILKPIGDAADYYKQHRAEIRELAALLTNEQVWDAVVIQAARAQMIQAMERIGKVNVKIPVIGDVNLQFDAPALIAASNILQSRLSPLAPVKASDVDTMLLREGSKALGLDPNSSDQQLVAGLFTDADRQLKQQLASRLNPLIDQAAGHYDPAALSRQILAAVPPEAALYLKQQYGSNLSGLLPKTLDTAALKQLLTTTLPDKVTAYLDQKYGPQIAQGLASATSWAGELLSRQINMTLIQMMLASEELNRLTVDHGRKIDDLDLRFAMRSFDMLDARGRDRAEDRLHDVKVKLAEQAANEETRLVDRTKAQGRLELQTLQLDPSWPEGLKIAVDDDSMAAIVAYYGDGPFFDLLGRMKERYAAKPHPRGLRVTFVLEADPERSAFGGLGGAAIWHSKGSPDLKIELSKPKDARDAAFKLSYLESYIDE